jgi:hypothetical protein
MSRQEREQICGAMHNVRAAAGRAGVDDPREMAELAREPTGCAAQVLCDINRIADALEELVTLQTRGT